MVALNNAPGQLALIEFVESGDLFLQNEPNVVRCSAKSRLAAVPRSGGRLVLV
jgi:hypothetical protein